jgi:hypothetical protein
MTNFGLTASTVDVLAYLRDYLIDLSSAYAPTTQTTTPTNSN